MTRLGPFCYLWDDACYKHARVCAATRITDRSVLAIRIGNEPVYRSQTLAPPPAGGQDSSIYLNLSCRAHDPSIYVNLPAGAQHYLDLPCGVFLQTLTSSASGQHNVIWKTSTKHKTKSIKQLFLWVLAFFKKKKPPYCNFFVSS